MRGWSIWAALLLYSASAAGQTPNYIGPLQRTELPGTGLLIGSTGKSLAGVTIGSGLSLSGGVLSAPAGTTTPGGSPGQIQINGGGTLSGISVGTGLVNSGGALSVGYGTAAGTAAQGNDSRITGALPASAVPTAALLGGTGGAFSSVSVGSGLTLSGGVLSAPTGGVTSVQVSGGTTGLTVSGGPITGSGTLTLGGTLGVANGGTGAASSTGSGSVVLASGPTLITPNLGTPSAVNLSNATGLPVSAVTGTVTREVCYPFDSNQTVTAGFVRVTVPWTSVNVVRLVGTTMGVSPSFVASVSINDVVVSGCSALTVNSSTASSAACTGSTWVGADVPITLTVSTPSGTPSGASVCAVLATSFN